jgi:hypothetical protein
LWGITDEAAIKEHSNLAGEVMTLVEAMRRGDFPLPERGRR